MPDFDLAIVNGTLVNSTGSTPGTVAIKDGRIAGVLAGGVAVDAEKVIDATGRHVFPGVIDPHVHMRTAGLSFGQTAERESKALIAGGVTTALVFTEAPHQSYHEVMGERIEAIGTHSYCDIGLHPMIQSLDHAREVPSIVERWGATSFKMYFAGGKRELYPGTFAIDDGTMYAAFTEIAKVGAPAMAMVHAENWEIAAVLQEELVAQGRVDAAAWTDSKPTFVEVESVQRAAFLATQAGVPLYYVHVSSGPGAAVIGAARREGKKLFGETCPHYLMVHKNHEKAIIAKFNPAVKEEEDNAALWRALADGSLQCMGSDHIPVRWPDKVAGGFDNVWTARGGIPGSPTILPLMLSEGVNKGRLTLEQVAAVTSGNAAQLFGLEGRKGSIATGYDADLVIVDVNRELAFDPALLQLDFTIFDGLPWKGWPEVTLLRGEIVMEKGAILGTAGQGTYLRRTKHDRR